MKSPSAIFMMLALCTAVTLCRLLSAAYLKAYSATLVLAMRVMICSVQRLASLMMCVNAEVWNRSDVKARAQPGAVFSVQVISFANR